MSFPKKTLIDLIPPEGVPPPAGGSLPPHVPPHKNAKPSPRFFRRMGFALAFLIAAALAFYGIGFTHLKTQSLASKERIAIELERAQDALTRLSPAEAHTSFTAIHRELGSIQGIADRFNLAGIARLFGTISDTLRAIPPSFAHLTALSGTAIETTAALETLKTNALSWFAGGEGARLLGTLRAFETQLDTAARESTALEASVPRTLGPEFAKTFFPFKTKLESTRRFLESIITWFGSTRERHVLVLFQNPSELRPGGGFLGSYAEVGLTGGAFSNIKVWDIYDPDGQLDRRITPPRELQFVTPRWGARDANWFFDFPLSAKKTIELLEASTIYTEQFRTFDAAIAININVLKTLLTVVGPIPLPDYDLTITADNVLEEIQREVEAGDDNRAGEPKRILKVLAPLLLNELGNLTDEKKQALALAMRDHVTNKDIMLYFKDLEMEAYLKELGVAGEVLPSSPGADYFALAEANVAGGKTDAVLSQHLTLTATIAEDGRVDHELTITRAHHGDTKKDWWYRTQSKSYLEAFLPPDAHITFARGGTLRTPPAFDSAAEYEEDTDLKAIEGTRVTDRTLGVDVLRESGKTVAATWMILPSGEERSLEFHYTTAEPFTLTGDRVAYPFVFEKQSGRESTLTLTIEAPPGFVWEETGNATFTYVSDRLPGRLVLAPTLIRTAPHESP